ncbi:hypothetical protein B296_00016026 [Ensete ventricosum]|uniref:Protein kinase domain-containing protein n=1 Tax=Ensete ventricosum TaxID=4639 RepID=A0A426YIC5_ENSVE|nr:hypothetical protein B296_00016026 [Ensete ventricosum]
MPHATVFKPQHPYENCLEETFDTLPESAFELLETFLSIEPDKRGTAPAALTSKISASKHIRRSVSSRLNVEATGRPSRPYKPSQESNGLANTASRREVPLSLFSVDVHLYVSFLTA